jgi:Fe-S cluster assembly protein SufD
LSLHPNPLQFAAGLTRGEPLPSRRHESWKYSDLARALRELPPESPAARPSGEGPFAGLAERELVFVNGREAGVQEGADAVSASPEPAPHANIVQLLAGGHARDVQPSWDAAAAVSQPDALSGAVSLRFISDAQGTAHETRLRLLLPEGASATLFETYEGSGSAYFANTLLEITLEAGARLERIILADEPDTAVSVSTAEVRLSAGASFSQTVLTSGARLQRLETHVRHPGAGAAVRLDGVYVLAGGRHADITTAVEHDGPGGTTAQLTKGVVLDTARSVFQGRITVREGADQTDARMGHHALILSDRAEVDAKPELEIWADDVSCAHGNTVGSLDQDALFYARARGMDEPTAKALLTEAFLGEVLDRMQHEGAREIAVAWLQERLR